MVEAARKYADKLRELEGKGKQLDRRLDEYRRLVDEYRTSSDNVCDLIREGADKHSPGLDELFGSLTLVCEFYAVRDGVSPASRMSDVRRAAKRLGARAALRDTKQTLLEKVRSRDVAEFLAREKK